MQTNTTNNFSKLYSIDVSEYVEKKGKFNYLSWSYAVKTLRENDPSATWEVIRFNGMPFMKTECGYFVEVAVTVQGITLSQIHPVLDNNNRPIAQPNSFQINTSIQRCLVKAIALHGLGLYIYAGEDLPDDDGNGASQDPTRSEQPRQTNTPTTQQTQSTGQPTQSGVISPAQVKYAHTLKSKKRISEEDFDRMVTEHGHEDIKQLTMVQAKTFINFLTAIADPA